MRAFPVPIQIIEAEKIFGGHLSLRQVVYIFLLGLGLGGSLAFLCPVGGVFCKFLILVFNLSWGLALAFVNVYDMGLDVFIIITIKWLKSPRRYSWERST